MFENFSVRQVPRLAPTPTGGPQPGWELLLAGEKNAGWLDHPPLGGGQGGVHLEKVPVYGNSIYICWSVESKQIHLPNNKTNTATETPDDGICKHTGLRVDVEL